MVRNGSAESHVRHTGISTTFITERKPEISSSSINSVLIMKEMVWPMKAPCLKVSSFYFGLLTTTKCDTGTRELGIYAKGYKSLLLSSDTGTAVQAGINHPMQQGYWITENRRERNRLYFLRINSAIIYQQSKTEKYTC